MSFKNWATVVSIIDEISRRRALSPSESQALEWAMRNGNQIHAKAWGDCEDQTLRELMANGHTSESVASQTGRTTGAVKARIFKLRQINE